MDVSHFTSQSMCKINVVAFLSPQKATVDATLEQSIN